MAVEISAAAVRTALGAAGFQPSTAPDDGGFVVAESSAGCPIDGCLRCQHGWPAMSAVPTVAVSVAGEPARELLGRISRALAGRGYGPHTFGVLVPGIVPSSAPFIPHLEIHARR